MAMFNIAIKMINLTLAFREIFQILPSYIEEVVYMSLIIPISKDFKYFHLIILWIIVNYIRSWPAVCLIK